MSATFVRTKISLKEVCSSGTNLASCIKAYGNKGSDATNVYIHDSSLVNGAGDNSYRFAGASNDVSNYVCFGSTVSPCPEDNLYRIIGVFDGRVKLIKVISVGNILWDSSNANNGYGSNTWSTSTLNVYLNNEFVNTFDAVAKGKIDTTTWKVGGNVWKNIGKQPAKTIYQNEVINPVPGSTSPNGEKEYSAKIGLMYVSDYGFAAAPSAWTVNLSSYSRSDILSTNWMFLDTYEWTITRSTNNLITAFFVSHDGAIEYNCVNLDFKIRPVFNLISSTTYVSGDGTKTEPIRIN